MRNFYFTIGNKRASALYLIVIRDKRCLYPNAVYLILSHIQLKYTAGLGNSRGSKIFGSSRMADGKFSVNWNGQRLGVGDYWSYDLSHATRISKGQLDEGGILEEGSLKAGIDVVEK